MKVPPAARLRESPATKKLERVDISPGRSEGVTLAGCSKRDYFILAGVEIKIGTAVFLFFHSERYLLSE